MLHRFKQCIGMSYCFLCFRFLSSKQEYKYKLSSQKKEDEMSKLSLKKRTTLAIYPPDHIWLFMPLWQIFYNGLYGMTIYSQEYGRPLWLLKDLLIYFRRIHKLVQNISTGLFERLVIPFKIIKLITALGKDSNQKYGWNYPTLI